MSASQTPRSSASAASGLSQTRHTTDVVEEVAPSVVQEQIKPIVREEQTTIVDKEHHIVHEQQRVQPVKDRVETEKHTQHVLPVHEAEYRMEMSETAKRALAEQQSKYKSTTTHLPAQYNKVEKEATGSDIVHHHVHETIQPVIQREVLEKEVVHTTAPVHEVIHERPVVHESTVEPTITMDDFVQKGGSLSGGESVARGERPGAPSILAGKHDSGKHQHTDAIATAGHIATGSSSAASSYIAHQI